jgi:hypothetical protein
VHRVGFLDVDDAPAHMLVLAHQRGVYVGAWLFDTHGALKGALKIADRMSVSCLS